MASEYRTDGLANNFKEFGAPSASPSFAQIVPYSRSSSEITSNNSKAVAKPKPSKSWSFAHPESQRKRRVASYKVYTAEGRVKSTLKSSVRWLKSKYADMRDGWL